MTKNKMAANILFLLYLLNQLTDLAQIFPKLMQCLSLTKELVKITYNKKQDGGRHTVFAISFEPIDRFSPDFHQIHAIFVHNEKTGKNHF